MEAGLGEVPDLSISSVEVVLLYSTYYTYLSTPQVLGYQTQDTCYRQKYGGRGIYLGR